MAPPAGGDKELSGADAANAQDARAAAVALGAAATDSVIHDDSLLETNLRVGKVATTVEAQARLASSTTKNPYPFTMAELAKAVRDTGAFDIDENKSLYYMARDFAILGLLYYFRPWFMTNWVLHVVWWNVVGFFGWALFVVGHDCGHRTFSTRMWVNDLCGHLTHSVILVPFHSWRISHYLHHCNHNHVEKDESWKPIPRAVYGTFAEWLKFVRFTPFLAFLYPYYLLSDNKWTSGNHFNPYTERLFTKEERPQVALSVGCVLVWLGTLLYKVPLWTLVDAYFVPILLFSAWLSMVTYLQHTDVKATYYRDGEWSYLKGALSTVDRSYFDWIDHFQHDIGTHVVHHLFFTKLPHYNLRKATAAIRPILGKYYLLDNTFFLKAFLNTCNDCHYVDDDGAVVAYKSPYPRVTPVDASEQHRLPLSNPESYANAHVGSPVVSTKKHA